MTGPATEAERLAELQAARLLLDRLGVSPSDLLGATVPRDAPEFADYIPRVAEAVSEGTRRVYGSYWNLIVREWGCRTLGEVTALDISQLSERAKSGAVVRRNNRGGRSAAEHLIGALRCVYRFAVADGIIRENQNPAIRVAKPRRLVRWQPVSPTLMSHLLSHHDIRGGPDSTEQLLRYANGAPITARRYDYLWQRLARHLPWVAAQQISTHWLRHTTLTWVERNFGFAVAQAYAGHYDHSRDASTTSTYVRAGVHEVAAALAALAGEPHPLCPEPPQAGGLGDGQAGRASTLQDPS